MTHPLSTVDFDPRLPHWRVAPAPSRLLDWSERLRQRTALARLDDRLLADVGLSRQEAAAESLRWD
ncbi:MAG: DUF1127 domain-containing protein [Pseudomonadota bacterium]